MVAEREFPFSEDLIQDLQRAMVLTDILTRPAKASVMGRHLPELLVAKVDNLRVYVNNLEHAPPHVHVCCNEEEVRYRIDDGTRLKPDKGLEKFDGVIRKWMKEHRRAIIQKWNESRPSDCTVGAMPVPPE